MYDDDVNDDDDDDVNDDDDDDGFSIGVKNAGRVSSSFALHVVLCIHIYIYIYIHTHTHFVVCIQELL